MSRGAAKEGFSGGFPFRKSDRLGTYKKPTPRNPRNWKKTRNLGGVKRSSREALEFDFLTSLANFIRVSYKE